LPFVQRYGKRDAESLTPTEAEAYVRNPAWTATYRANILATLSTAFRRAEREKIIGKNPLHGIRKPPKASRGAKALVSADAQARLMKHAQPFF
jgi:integrase